VRACVCGVDEILSISARFVKHLGAASNISARLRQTFRLDARLGSAKCRELSQLICRDVDFFAERTNERTNAHFSKQFFLSNVSVSHVSKLPVIYLMLILLLEISRRPIQF
jgi:hypothetical protein